MDETEQLAEIFKALADPVRLRILTMLPHMTSDKTICVQELAVSLGLTQPNVSHHLGILKTAGLVTCEKRAGFSYYRVDWKIAQKALKDLESK